MATSVTKRLSSSLTESTTKRVTTTGGSDAIAASLGGDAWGGAWGGFSAGGSVDTISAFGGTFSYGTVAVAASGANPYPDNTVRVSAAATASNTNRVSAAPTAMTTLRIHHLLLLEGDESGYLLLEGDAQTGTDKLELEGDEASITINVTQRVVTVT